MPHCAASACSSQAKGNKGSDISFHCFPQDPDLRKVWENACGREQLPKDARLCSLHFTADSFVDCFRPHLVKELTGASFRRRLKTGAVPTIFSPKEAKRPRKTNETRRESSGRAAALQARVRTQTRTPDPPENECEALMAWTMAWTPAWPPFPQDSDSEALDLTTVSPGIPMPGLPTPGIPLPGLPTQTLPTQSVPTHGLPTQGRDMFVDTIKIQPVAKPGSVDLNAKVADASTQTDTCGRAFQRDTVGHRWDTVGHRWETPGQWEAADFPSLLRKDHSYSSKPDDLDTLITVADLQKIFASSRDRVHSQV